MTSSLESALSVLITANHVLHHHGLVDGFGHVSVRDPEDPSTFHMTGSTPTAFVKNKEDLFHYHIHDGSPVAERSGSTSPWSERFCHSAIYKRYSGVMSVVHSHSQPVVAWGVCDVPLRAVYHMSGFLADGAPIFDAANCYKEGDRANFLINSNALGDELARSFSPNGGAEKTLPEHAVVLQRGHGFMTWGNSIQEAVYRAIYTQENAKIQMDAINIISANIGVGNREHSVRALDEKEATDCTEMNKASVFKAWAYWSRLVEANLMYQNDIVRNQQSERDYRATTSHMYKK